MVYDVTRTHACSPNSLAILRYSARSPCVPFWLKAQSEEDSKVFFSSAVDAGLLHRLGAVHSPLVHWTVVAGGHPTCRFALWDRAAGLEVLLKPPAVS